jgi:transcription-repair coupling factor (superfamily II helicase)
VTSYRSFNIPKIADGTALEDASVRASSCSRFDLKGLEGGSLAPLLVEFAKRQKIQVVAVVDEAERAPALAQDLRYHLAASSRGKSRGSVLNFAPYDFGPYDELIPDRNSIMERTGVLFQLTLGADWRFLVAEAEAVLRKLIPRAEFESACTPIAVGDRLDRDALRQCLENGGYHHSPLVEEPGTFAMRGSLVDVFPPYLAKPVRIDMFGPDIEKLRLFDPATQASAGEIEEFWVHPVRLALLPGDGDRRREAADRLRALSDSVNQPTRRTEQMIEDLLTGRALVGAQRFEPAFHPLLGSLLDYLPKNAVVCLDNPTGVRLAWQKVGSALAGEFERRRASLEPVFPPEQHVVSRDKAESFLQGRRLIFAHRLAVVETEESVFNCPADASDLRAHSTDNLSEQIRQRAPSDEKSPDLVSPFAQYLKELAEEGYRTTIVAHRVGQAERLASMLRARSLKIEVVEGEEKRTAPGTVIAVGELARGCILPADARCWIAEEEVFGRRSRRRREPKRSRKALLDDLRMLKPGDLLVHVEHGIGRYEGLVRKKIRRFEMDFLEIVYRDQDKLYLPVYRLNQVHKYKGGEGHVRLDKLGGQTFARAVSSARQATREMAGQLLDLYARRAAAVRKPIDPPDDLYRAFEAGFPFEETEDQERAIDEVAADLKSGRPMDRLICGDVGFGKTEVAMRAAFRIAMEGLQVAVLVPTTVLAQQHYQSFKTRFEPYPMRVEMLSRFRSPSQNRSLVLALKEGSIDIVVGTHRLLSTDVHFKRLGLLVIDEEHRFGVAHKERIRALKSSVDTLVLTATPIPRTLSMALGGVRDLSLIGTAPASRRSVRTIVCHDDPAVLGQALQRELAREGQVFFVHNRVRDLNRVRERVQQMAPKARVALAHGQMKEEKLETAMLDFVAGRYDILLCTSIIESGLDIPRANTIIVDRADAFGMAQLYQLRGRVGRWNRQAYAYLVIPPLSMLNEEAKQRVETLARYTDLGSGFSVATMDMELRGAGNLLGKEQSGNVNAVGFEMFCDLLSEAASELRGIKRERDIEPELTFEQPGYFPEEYLPDVGQRLEYYKQLASAGGEQEVESIAADLIDRFGPLPKESEELIEIMAVKALSRALGIRGVEATSRRLTIHLGLDSKIDPDTVIGIVREEQGRVQLTNDLKIKMDFKDEEPPSAKAAIKFLHRLSS